MLRSCSLVAALNSGATPVCLIRFCMDVEPTGQNQELYLHVSRAELKAPSSPVTVTLAFELTVMFYCLVPILAF